MEINNKLKNKINHLRINQNNQVVKIILLLIDKILELCSIQIHFNCLKILLKHYINFKNSKKKIKIKLRIILKTILLKCCN